jgi:hypothetical protein
MIKTYSLSKDGNKKLSTNFTVREFACKDGSDKILIDSELVEVLQKIREHFGKAITINSAYRNPTYNKKIGGVSNSQHTKGTATDIVVSGVSPLEIAQYAEYIMPNKGGIGQYNDFVHIDVRANRARWTNFGKEKSVSGFYGYSPELKTGNEIIWELMNGKHKVKITQVDKAVKAVDNAKISDDFSSLYWILYKLVNGNG